MSKPKFTITIEVEGGTTVATISDSTGTVKTVEGLALFGLSTEVNELYGFAWGDPHHAATAVGEVLAQAVNREDPFYLAFYRALLADMMLRTGVRPEHGQEVTAKDILDAWEEEDAKSKKKTYWN